MVEKRRFDRMYNAIETMNYTKYDDVPVNEEIFVYGFKQIKRVKINNHILIGCESHGLFENDQLFNFWANKFTNKLMEKRYFKITGWPFMTLVKRNNVFNIQSIVCS